MKMKCEKTAWQARCRRYKHKRWVQPLNRSNDVAGPKSPHHVGQQHWVVMLSVSEASRCFATHADEILRLWLRMTFS